MKLSHLLSHLRFSILCLLWLCACGKGSDHVTITLWHGQGEGSSAESVMLQIATSFAQQNPDVTVNPTMGRAPETMLPELNSLVATTRLPDICYIFGTDTPNIVASRRVVDLTDATKDPAFAWQDFQAPGRLAATLNGRVIGITSVIDNLALVYNRTLFAQAGVPEPTASWTWDDYRNAAKALTTSTVWGGVYPTSGQEDTVWRFWPMVWQQNGKTLSDDSQRATFTTPEFLRALELLRAMAIEDRSMLLDPIAGDTSVQFANGLVAMHITGPWDLSSFESLDIGVAALPAFGESHETISGADNWIVFNNDVDRVDASIRFLKFLTEPAQDALWSVEQGNLPVRMATEQTEAWKEVLAGSPGLQEFADNFGRIQHTRPQTVVYPAYSSALGAAIVAVLSGEKTTAEALQQANDVANAALSAANTPVRR